MQDLKNMVEQYLDAVPRRDFGLIRQMLHQQYSYTGGDGKKQEGPEAGIKVMEMATKAFPDLFFDIQHMIVSGNIIVTEFLSRGTHKGELMGISPTGKNVVVPMCNIIEIRDGKIFSEREYFDALFMMQQLGVEVGHEHA